MIPTVFTSSFHYFQGPSRVYSAAVIGTIASIAPTLGPVIGGWITDSLGWHWLFYVNVLPGMVIAALAPFLVRDRQTGSAASARVRIIPASLLMAICLGTLEYVLEDGTRWNWFDDTTIKNCAYIAALAGVLFLVRSLSISSGPSSIFGPSPTEISRSVAFCLLLPASAFSPRSYLTPLFLGYVRGFSAWQIWCRDIFHWR